MCYILSSHDLHITLNSRCTCTNKWHLEQMNNLIQPNINTSTKLWHCVKKNQPCIALFHSITASGIQFVLDWNSEPNDTNFGDKWRGKRSLKNSKYFILALTGVTFHLQNMNWCQKGAGWCYNICVEGVTLANQHPFQHQWTSSIEL